MKKTRIVIADSRRLFAETLGRVLDGEHDLHVTGYAADGLEALHLVRERAPDVLVIGGSLPKYDGPEVIRELSGSGGKTRFLLLAEEVALDRLAELYESGIHGCVLLTSGIDDLLKAVRGVSRGGSGFDTRITGDLPDILLRARKETDLFDDLTPREKEVVYWIGQGFNNAKVAETMVLSEKTVKNHVGHILKKLELRDRTQIAVLAWSTGLAVKTPDQIRKN
ncbi:MAG: LuxR C-terminal-related transcriptional regulator [Thermovirgaceae bacterium]